MADFRKINEHYAEVAAELIAEEPALEYIAKSNVTIIYLSSDSEKTNKGNAVCGQCEKVPDKYRWGIPADFTITVFEPNVEKFTDEQIKILLFHELLHIGIEEDGNEERYFIRPHDLEDFKLIIDRFGTEWSWAE